MHETPPYKPDTSIFIFLTIFLSLSLAELDTLSLYIFQLNEDPTFKPQGGRLGENDMDYDTNEKTMAQLRRQLKRARERYYRYKRYALTEVAKYLWGLYSSNPFVSTVIMSYIWIFCISLLNIF